MKLYTLVWRRAVASQMASAELDQTIIDVIDRNRRCALRATRSAVVFDGFLTLYQEDPDEPSSADAASIRILPSVARVADDSRPPVPPAQHFTQAHPAFLQARQATAVG